MLHRITSFIAVLLLLMTAAPVMACVTQPQMMQTNHACCQTMHGKCGSEMAKSGCCRVEMRDQEPQMAVQASGLSLHVVAVVLVYFDLAAPPVGLPARWLAPDEHSPPLPRSTKPDVLRI